MVRFLKLVVAFFVGIIAAATGGAFFAGVIHLQVYFKIDVFDLGGWSLLIGMPYSIALIVGSALVGIGTGKAIMRASLGVPFKHGPEEFAKEETAFGRGFGSGLTALLLAFFAYYIYVSVTFQSSRPERFRPDATSRTPVQHFRELAGTTMTPHGRINVGSIRETDDGKIQYQTEDGKTWRVTMTKQADGTYRYGVPDEVK